MANAISWIFDSGDLAPHGMCLLWRPDLLWSFVVADSLIAAAYFSIPAALVVLARKRKDLAFPWVFLLFGAFILLCGTTHLTDVLTLWVPAYGVTVAIRAVTAAVSVATAVILWPLMPKILALPSLAQLQRLNEELRHEVLKRARAETALRDLNAELEQRVVKRTAELEATFEQAAVGIAHVGPDGKWLRVNSKLCDIIGYDRDELLSITFQDITHPDDLKTDLDQVRRMLAGEIKTYSLAKRFVRRNGSLVWINLTVSLVRDARGHPDYFISVIEDIQKRVEAEQEVARLNADLERRVRERTAELETANGELDSFAYAVSHDLRAPVRAMSSFAQALEEDFGTVLPSGAREFITEIVTASRRMGELIEGLLVLSRCTRAELQKERFDLTEMARGIFREFTATNPSRDVECQIQAGLTAYGDPRMLSAVMHNLMENAWKYTARTEQAIIRVHAETKDDRLFYCVSDNGAGFDMAFSQKLFQPFQRLHRQDEFPGIGIGLATAQRVILRHGGKIEASSSPGSGATFRFMLPDTDSLEKEVS